MKCHIHVDNEVNYFLRNVHQALPNTIILFIGGESAVIAEHANVSISIMLCFLNDCFVAEIEKAFTHPNCYVIAH